MEAAISLTLLFLVYFLVVKYRQKNKTLLKNLPTWLLSLGLYPFILFPSIGLFHYIFPDQKLNATTTNPVAATSASNPVVVQQTPVSAEVTIEKKNNCLEIKDLIPKKKFRIISTEWDDVQKETITSSEEMGKWNYKTRMKVSGVWTAGRDYQFSFADLPGTKGIIEKDDQGKQKIIISTNLNGTFEGASQDVMDTQGLKSGELIVRNNCHSVQINNKSLKAMIVEYVLFSGYGNPDPSKLKKSSQFLLFVEGLGNYVASDPENNPEKIASKIITFEEMN
jgi:uncharacterized membrane protein YhdT